MRNARPDINESTVERRTENATGTTMGQAIRRVLCVATVVAWATSADAQAIRGTVLQADSSSRAPGVIVVASDERGQVVARTLSTDVGDFDLQLPGAGKYTVRLLRVGFRPTAVPVFEVPASGTQGLRLVLGTETVVLSAVTVRTENVCGSTEDTGRVLAQIWEEARKALTATELSTGSRVLDVEWQAFQFLMDRAGNRSRDQYVLLHRGATERPFVSVSADSLLRDGYVVTDGNDLVYRAPDAAALLSDEFAATHCFRVEPPAGGRSQWVGVAFRPTPARDRMREIMGTVWLDRATAELRLLEFAYTNLPPEAGDAGIGGYVEYVRLATGHWLVARWAIRTPHMVVRTVGGSAIPGGGRVDRVALAAVGVTGGELLSVRRASDSLYLADASLVATEGSAVVTPARPSACGAAYRPGATVRGKVTNASLPAEGAVVSATWRVVGASADVTLSTVTDRRGEFTIPCVARGVPLTIAASLGDLRGAPSAVGPISGGALAVDIQLEPVPPR